MASTEFLPGVICLIKSIRRFSQIPIEIMSIDLNEEEIESIYSAGGIVREIPRITSIFAEIRSFHIRKDFSQNCFCKLNMWGMDYDKIVYLDSDTVVIQNIDELFDVPHFFSACPSIITAYNAKTMEVVESHHCSDFFNAGVLVLKPDKTVYLDMMRKKDVIKNDADLSDQGFLNSYFKNKVNILSAFYNATKRAHDTMSDWWKMNEDKIKVIHYTATDKPWMKGRTSPIDRYWWNVFK